MTRDECILLGTIAKAHGVKGEVILRTPSETYEPQKKWGTIFLEIDGILVPFFIADLSPHKNNEWVLNLEDYHDKQQAEELSGLAVYVPSKLLNEQKEEIFLDALIGYQLSDQTSGLEGPVTDFMDIAENPVFEVSFPGGKVLVPAREEWILELDEAAQRLVMELPEGLAAPSD
jgi:16S rRNA processing protein RimM